LLTCLLLGACWGDDGASSSTATPEANAAAPVSALPTSATAVSAAAAPTAIATAATPEGIAALLSTPDATAVVADSGTISTAPGQTVTPTAVPLEAAQASDCAVETNLDLVGYPDLEKVMGCATGPANNDPVAIDEFGDADPIDRFMLWFGDEKKIYVLLPDGSYKTYDDTWEEGKDPTFSCNPLGGEEKSPPLPRRGFGKLWCSQPELQKVLGTVPREERLCQYAVLQRFETGRLLACFEDATIRYFRLLDDGKWDLQMQ
jgi:hypothetical protein